MSDELFVTVANPELKPHDYEAEPVSIIVILDSGTGLWHVFEGTFDVKEKTYKIVLPISAFPINTRDPWRLPDQVFRIAQACASAKCVGLWIP